MGVAELDLGRFPPIAVLGEAQSQARRDAKSGHEDGRNTPPLQQHESHDDNGRVEGAMNRGDRYGIVERGAQQAHNRRVDAGEHCECGRDARKLRPKRQPDQAQEQPWQKNRQQRE